MAIKHSTTKAPGQKLFAAADWNVDHTGTATPESHGIADATKHTSAATNGKMLKANANGLPVDASNTDADVDDAVTKKHTRQHAITSSSDHTSAATSGKILKADANGLPIDASDTDADVHDAVAKKHTQNSDTYLNQGGGNEVTAANAKDAVSKKHTQNTDTALGANCEAADHGTAATDMVVNVCYGTGDPPAANTTTEGTIYLKYTA